MADSIDVLRSDALAALGDVLRAPTTRPADRLRAAEAILRADAQGIAPTGDLLALADQELLRIARGGGTPPERGPRDSSAGAVPSHAIADRLRDLGEADRLRDLGEADRLRDSGEADRLRDGGDLPNAIKPRKGTQKGPTTGDARGAPRKAFDFDPDPDPWM